MKALALDKINKINEVLAASSIPHNGLLSGALGLSYYYYHAGASLQDAALVAKGETLLATIFEEVNGSDARLNGTAYSNGAAGFAYTVSNLQRNGLIDFDLEEDFSDLDEYLFEAACTQLEKGDIDYLHGAMGTFHYFASRQQTETVSRYLNTLAGMFMTRAVASEGGAYFSNYSLQRLEDKADLGLAHGLSGLLMLLIGAWPALKDQARAEQLIREGIAFILPLEAATNPAQQQYSLFPFTIDRDKTITKPNRLAWCYGDLNIALLLIRAGKLLNEPQYLEAGERIGLETIKRKSEATTLSTDTHFCHGSAGLAQFYKCLYRESGNDAFRDAYLYWITETLNLTDKEILEQQYQTNPVSLLDGWTGVAMVLADYASEENPAWAGAFLL